MSDFDRYKPFVAVKNAINKLEAQGAIKLMSEKDQVADAMTKIMIESGVFREFIRADRPHPTNIHNALEEFITEGGRPIYINKMQFDNHESTLTLDLQFNPESTRIDKILKFRNIQKYEETIHDEEDANYIDSIIGLSEYSTKYVLTTELRKITFFSEATPEISPNP